MMAARDTFARALAATEQAERAPGAPAASPTPPASPAPLPHSPAPIGMDSPIVDPRTGELLAGDLDDEATDRLADLLLELETRVARFKAWHAAIDAVLRQRLENEGRRKAVVGDYELEVESGRTRAWDPDDLTLVVGDLISKGVLSSKEVADLITTERKVNGTLAKRLLSRLAGDAREQLEGCYTWQAGRPKVRVTRTVDLADALPSARASDVR